MDRDIMPLFYDLAGSLTAKFPEDQRVLPGRPDTIFNVFRVRGVSHSMLLQHYGVGHHALPWYLRQHSRVREVTAALLRTTLDDLTVSFDGVSICGPYTTLSSDRRRGIPNTSNWLHCDQAYRNSAFSHSYQSFVSLFDTEAGDATLGVLVGSHKLHADFYDAFAAGYEDKFRSAFYKLTSEQIRWFTNRGCNYQALTFPAGSLVFWDSRTVHQGQPGLRCPPGIAGLSYTKNVMHNPRCVVYLCYGQRSQLTAAERQKKRSAFEAGRMTTHDPYKSILVPVNPNNWGGVVAPDHTVPDTVSRVSVDELGPVGRSLACL
jgi:hypothetical protein